MEKGVISNAAVQNGGETNQQTAAQKPKKRIYSIDLIKSLAIIMACSLHYPLYVEGSFVTELWQLFCIGAVPAFFMVNGYFLFSKPYDGKKHKRKIVDIILGLLFWKTIILVGFMALGYVGTEMLSLSNIFQYYFTNDKMGILPTEHMWFMYALLSMYILFPFFKSVFDQGKGRYLLWICILGFILRPLLVDLTWLAQAANFFLGTTFNIDFTIYAGSLNPFGIWGWYLCFFLMGYFVWTKIDALKEKMSSPRYLLLSVGILAVGIAIALLQDYVYHGTITWTGFVLPLQYAHVATIIVAIGFIMLCTAIPLGNRVVQQALGIVSTNTLTIYYLHMPILLFFSSFFGFEGFAANMARVLLVSVFAIVVGQVMKRIPGLKRIS